MEIQIKSGRAPLAPYSLPAPRPREPLIIPLIIQLGHPLLFLWFYAILKFRDILGSAKPTSLAKSCPL